MSRCVVVSETEAPAVTHLGPSSHTLRSLQSHTPGLLQTTEAVLHDHDKV